MIQAKLRKKKELSAIFIHFYECGIQRCAAAVAHIHGSSHRVRKKKCELYPNLYGDTCKKFFLFRITKLYGYPR